MARILIADDQKSVRALIRSILEAQGHEVIEACNGREAIRLSSPEPDLVVTDILMPDGDGLEVIHHMKSHQCASPVLVVTSGWANPDLDLLKVARKLGADRVMPKGKVASDLIAIVNEMLSSAPSPSL